MFKDNKGYGKVSLTNSELSEKINMPESTISKCNRSLTSKEYLSIMRCKNIDEETGIQIQEKIFHLDELGQAVIWALTNHETRIQNNEQRISNNEKDLKIALDEIARLKDEMNELKQCLLGNKDINQIESLNKHIKWYKQLSKLDINSLVVAITSSSLCSDSFSVKHIPSSFAM